jgi:hypothetical protein
LKSLFTISAEQQGLFGFFYLLVFAWAIFLMIITGFRKKYSKAAWYLILASAVIFFVIGNKFFTYTYNHILKNLSGHKFINSGNKTVLEGIFGVVIGIGLAKKNSISELLFLMH